MKLSLQNIANGRANEVFAMHLTEVLKNMVDRRTDERPRKLILEFEMTPDEDRKNFSVTVKGKTQLSALKGSVKGMGYISVVDGKVSATPDDPDQLGLGLELVKRTKEQS